MDVIKQLLTEIKEGKSSFQPASNSKADMADFQSVAKILIYADQEDWLNSIEVHRESRTKNNWYDLIIVQGGLSYKGGGQYITNPPTVNSTYSEAQEDIIELKPNFMGLGINLNALFRYFKKKKG